MKTADNKTHSIVRRGRVLLAVLGLLLALFGSRLVQTPQRDGEVLAWVNHQSVTREQLAFAQDRLMGGSAYAMSAEQRQAIINLLIDEELLLQRAENLGTYSSDPGVRKAIVQAVIDEVVEEYRNQVVDTLDLKRFFEQHQAVFERPPRVAVKALRFESQADAQRARAEILAGAKFTQIARDKTSSAIAQLPSSPMPTHMLRRYLGTALTDVALTLEQGETSPPVTHHSGVYLLRATVVQRSEIPAFESVQEKVRTEYQFRGRENALENTIAQLWGAASIDINYDVAGGLAEIEGNF
ncbi:MAG: parvulin-like peptidyl-prolyl isomerase [Halioglobus sp.]|jgi:parvulin-like peptidyl-prolyl isomerase